jgi:hypothetical protein
MIGAMWLTAMDLIDRYQPDLFVSYVVDRYLLDVFERALARRGVRYVGLAIGILPEQVMFMAKGEYQPLREPSRTEIDTAVRTLTERNFVPTYVPSSQYTLGRFLNLYTRFTARWLVFELLMLWRRNPLDFRYLSTRRAACGYRIRLRDWAVMKYFRPDWRDVLEATDFSRRIFVGLSVNPEAAIEYWVKNPEMIDTESVLLRLAASAESAGFRLFVKDHPSQFGFRQAELFEKLSRYGCVTFVPYEVTAPELIKLCKATFTWTGTVGFQAAMAGRCAVVEEGAYYFVPGRGFVVMTGLDDVDNLPKRIDSWNPPKDLAEHRRVLVRHILRASVPGDYLSWRSFSATDEQRQRVQSLVDSMNRYFPGLSRRSGQRRSTLRMARAEGMGEV